MQRTMLKSKIHRATVTDACVDYEGSIGVDKVLLEAADILENEQVHVWNVSNAQRFVTYAIELPENSGRIEVNGAAAKLVSVGDLVIIASFGLYKEEDLYLGDSSVAAHNLNQAILVFVDMENKQTNNLLSAVEVLPSV